MIRGVWVLSNIFGAPPPPPLPNVPALDESTVAANLPMRERLAAHRSNAVCASCHRTIDPVGFSLENFDAVGRWRDHEGDDGPDRRVGRSAGRRRVPRRRGPRRRDCLSRPELFAGNADGEAADVRAGPRRRVLRRAGGPQDRARRREGRIPLLVAHPRNRQERAVSDEESIMIITKKALPRRTFLRGAQAALALPLLDAMIPAVTAWAKTPAKPVRRLGFVFIPMGCDHARWTPPGQAKLDGAVADPGSARAGQGPGDRHHQHAGCRTPTRARTPRRTRRS